MSSDENCFCVPKEARWRFLQDSAKQPNIGKLLDDAMVAIERDNPRLKGILCWRLLSKLQHQRQNSLTDRHGTSSR